MNSKNIKLAIFDIDGTLVIRGKNHIETSAVKAIRILHQKGIAVMVATGRAYYFIHDDVLETLKPDFVVTINGACVYNKERHVVYEVPMNPEEIHNLVQYSRNQGLGIGLKLEEEMRIYHDMAIFQNIYLHGSPKTDILKDYTGAKPPTAHDKILGVFMMGDEMLIEASQAVCPHGFYAKAYHNAYDVYAQSAGKMRGIDVVLNQLKLNWDEVISFGDADNDIDMLEAAGIGVALGNASMAAKAAADYITTAINADGIKNALKHFKLID